ncbi:extradiol dioxygenase [Kribbella sp. NPDC051718]|uniref:VOC family protein n=1 Tax=Kribbella sp. NPDC051718 TaxID=3155168 RepID=UPI00343E9F7B
MINGAHVIIYSQDAEADRNFLRDVLGYPHVDAGHGWLIFKLPPAEVAVHPADGAESHELFLMCDNLAETITALQERGVEFPEPPQEQRWGILTTIRLPGGGNLGLYQPHHEPAYDL